MYSGTGMYKLKYFCQICNKQCRDKDGFKCHLNSNTHKINLEIVSQNPDQFIDSFSRDFEYAFLDIIKRNYPNIFVSANKVYQEYIEDKDSIHLNATKWNSLTIFLKHLESNEKVLLQVNDKETKIKYIDKNFENLKERQVLEKKEREEIYEEKKRKREFEKYYKFVEKDEDKSNEPLKRNGEIEITMKKTDKVTLKIEKELLGHKRQHDEEKHFSKFDSSHPWVTAGLIVRIKDKSLTNHYNKKGKVLNLINEYFTETKVDGVVIKIDQEYLDPVIPQSGEVKILYGSNKDKIATIDSIDIKSKIAKLKINSNIEIVDIKGICKYTNY